MEAEQQPPPSPGEGPVQLKDCIEEIMKLTLTSSIKGELDIGLSKDFCIRLLLDDPLNPFPSTAEELSEGVPCYPLYKHLAASLYQSISSGALVSMPMKFSLSEEDDVLKLKEDEWTALIMENGSQLQDMLKAVKFELHVQEPFFTQLHDGEKTIEGRCAYGNYSRYVAFHEMLEAEGLQKVLPGVACLEEGVQVYRRFYSEEKERSNGVIAICVAKPSASLCSYMTSILSGLGYVGVQRLLNMGHTVGTIPEALPPPTSTLVSSFLAPHNEHVHGSMLTDGARALAKHVHRSSSKYWGNFCGSDSDKNRLALDIINHFISHCCWLNIHIVPSHGVVFEVRVAEGYGARWSEDGQKFIGFLEPYMVDGHQKGWKH